MKLPFYLLWISLQVKKNWDRRCPQLTFFLVDGFGFMLAFGNFCWVPMMYSLQARYLSDFPVDLSYWMMAIVIGLEVGGYYIFRSANGQKDTFRQKPDDPRNKGKEGSQPKSPKQTLIRRVFGVT